MTHHEFDAVFESAVGKLRDLCHGKGREYAGGEERFGNFMRLADRLKLTREQVLMVYFMKHLDSIETFIREKGAVPLSEPIQGRVIDAILYLLILYGMFEESNKPQVQVGSGVYSTSRHDRHLFLRLRGTDQCDVCGCEEKAPIHIVTHIYVARYAGTGPGCMVCGFEAAHLAHF